MASETVCVFVLSTLTLTSLPLTVSLQLADNRAFVTKQSVLEIVLVL